MSDINVSNMSWTNKDFQEVYPELLNKAQEMSPKWNPTVSNETDPGIVLIKEIALGVDKNNYVSDKNALENFPLSVTQQESSRQIFNLLGYYPHWYLSCVCSVAFSWGGELDTSINPATVTIPRFTQITDDSSESVYTLTNSVIVSGNKEITVGKVIEGSIRYLSINGTEQITEDLIDKDNRVYLEDLYVAQNGIYVNNYDNNGEILESDWEAVDNLQTTSLGKNVYKFGIDQVTGYCYIEFPQDISAHIGNGLSIKYIVSQGAYGDINPSILTQFLEQEVTGTKSAFNSEPEDIQLSKENILIDGISIVSNGEDPESIDESYKNYKHTVGTYETLVTLRDYANAFYNMEDYVSNSFVCDRTSDVQTGYRIMSESNGVKFFSVYNEEDNNNDYDFYTPFDLKLFAFQFNNALKTKDDYDVTFKLYDSTNATNQIISELAQLIQKIEGKNCISHTFRDVLSNKICALKNYYDIDCRIIPAQILSDIQKKEITENILTNLYKNFNSRMVDFGEPVDYQKLQLVIQQSDVKIKQVILGNISYRTDALFYEDAARSNSLTVNIDSEQFDVPIGWKEVVVSDEHPNYISGYYYNQKFYEDSAHTKEVVDDGKYLKTKLYLDLTVRNDNTEGISSNKPCNYVFEYSQNKFSLVTTMSNKFRDEIVVKNILCGNTPVFKDIDFDFQYQINQQGQVHEDVAKISTNRDYVFDLSTTGIGVSEKQNTQSTKNVLENEVIMFCRPTTETLFTYGNYVKYQYFGKEGSYLSKGELHTLASNEHITFLYKEDSDDPVYTLVRYGEGCVVKPTFTISASAIDEFSSYIQVSDTTYGAKDAYSRKIQTISDKNKVEKIEKYSQYLTSTKTVDVLQTNIRALSNDNSFWYAVTQTKTDDGKKYKLTFLKDGDEYKYQLKQDEYFIYTNSEKSSWNVYGSGTLLKYKSSNTSGSYEPVWYCDVQDIQSINKYRLQSLQSFWKTFPADVTDMTVTEQEYINVLNKGTLTISRSTQDYPVVIKLSSSGITYQDSVSQEIENRPAFFKTYDSIKTNIVFKDSESETEPSELSIYRLIKDSVYGGFADCGQLNMSCNLVKTRIVREVEIGESSTIVVQLPTSPLTARNDNTKLQNGRVYSYKGDTSQRTTVEYSLSGNQVSVEKSKVAEGDTIVCVEYYDIVNNCLYYDVENIQSQTELPDVWITDSQGKVLDKSISKISAPPTSSSATGTYFCSQDFRTYEVVSDSQSGTKNVINSDILKWTLSGNDNTGAGKNVIISEWSNIGGNSLTDKLGVTIVKSTSASLPSWEYSFNYESVASGTPVDLSIYTVRYKNTDDSSENTLSKSTSEQLKWTTKSYLNIDVSNNRYQKLVDSGQSVTFTKSDGSVVTISPTDSNNPEYILCNNDFYTDGSATDVDIYTKDVNDKIVYKQFYSFKKTKLYEQTTYDIFSSVSETNQNIQINVPKISTDKNYLTVYIPNIESSNPNTTFTFSVGVSGGRVETFEHVKVIDRKVIIELSENFTETPNYVTCVDDSSKLQYSTKFYKNLDNNFIAVPITKRGNTALVKNNYVFKFLANLGTKNLQYIDNMFLCATPVNSEVVRGWECDNKYPKELQISSDLYTVLKSAFTQHFDSETGRLVSDDCDLRDNFKTYYISYPNDLLENNGKTEDEQKILYLFVKYNNTYKCPVDLVQNMSYLKAYQNSDIFDYSRSELFTKLNKDQSYDLFIDIDDSKLIKNPLLAQSFLQSNHFYNQFTLCQISNCNIVINQ